jgi:hypothetical protein
MGNVYNTGKQWLQENDFVAAAAAGDIFMLLMKTSYVLNIDTHIDRDDLVVGTNEADVAGYVVGGIALTSVTTTVDTGTDQSILKAARVVYGSPVGGNTIGSGVILYQAAGILGTDPLICYVELPDTATNGQAFSVDFSGADPGAFLTYDDA